MAVALLVASLAGLAWRSEGGRWFVVRTASMGQAAPVGTLLLTKPTTVAAVKVGDIITFHEPGSGVVYSHRVVKKTAHGLRTRGDINGSRDPWVVTNRDLVGKVVHRWWDAGWVLRALPLLLLCLALVWLATTFVRFRRRAPLRVIGTALSFAVVGYVFHPWIGLEQISLTPARHGAVMRVVSVGILPTRAAARYGGAHVRLVDGQVGTIPVSRADAHHAYVVNASPALSMWWWVALVLVCLTPLLWCLLVGLEPVPEAETTFDAEAGADAPAADVVPVAPDEIDVAEPGDGLDERPDDEFADEGIDLFADAGAP